MLKKLFVCCTPYQVFNSINLMFNNINRSHEQWDLVLCNHFEASVRIINQCEKSGAWNNCYYMITEYKRSYIQTMKIIYQLDFGYMINNCKNSFRWDYDEVYIGTFNNISSIISYRYCKKYNKKLYILDEGIGTYTIHSFIEGFQKKQRILRWLTGQIISPRKIESILLYCPECYCGKPKVKIRALPKVDRTNKKLTNLLSTIFEYEKEESLKEVIFFDQPIKDLVVNNERIAYEQMIEIIFEIIKQSKIEEDFLIKWHPQTDIHLRNKFADNSIKSNSSGGWEVFLLDSLNSKKHIYISFFSSAALLGKMLFDDNDIIIFLYKIINFSVKGLEDVLNAMVKNGAEIYMPSSFSELRDLLDKYYKR